MQRIPREPADPALRAADRALLLERVAAGLAHEGKNPLHNMMLHLQLMSEKLAAATGGVDKHLTALRDGIHKVDLLLRAFGEMATAHHLPPDLGAAVARVVHLAAYEARRAGVQLHAPGPGAQLVQADPDLLGDLVGHATLAAIDLGRGGNVTLTLEPRGAVVQLVIVADGVNAAHEHAAPHLAALRRLAPDAGCELSLETSEGGVARLSLSFLHPR